MLYVFFHVCHKFALRYPLTAGLPDFEIKLVESSLGYFLRVMTMKTKSEIFILQRSLFIVMILLSAMLLVTDARGAFLFANAFSLSFFF